MLKVSVFILAILLAGCSQTPGASLKYYMFDTPPPPVERTANTTQHLLRINPVLLRGALNNRGILMRLSDQRIHAANYHRWSESPSAILTTTLEQQLLGALDNWMVVKSTALATDNLQQNYYQLDVELQRFNGSTENNAELAGIWRLSRFTSEQGQKILMLKSFNINQPLDRDGYEALVAALGKAWHNLNGEIAASLKLARTVE